MGVYMNSWRPLILGLAAASMWAGAASGENMSLKQRIERCGSCHGADGNSRAEKIPSLAGQPEFFILNQLFLMREGVRKIEAMEPFVKDLTDADIEALAKHFAALEPKSSGETVDASLAQHGADL